MLANTPWVVGSCVAKSVVIKADIYWMLTILSTLYVLTHLFPVTAAWDSRVQILTPLPSCVNVCNLFDFLKVEVKGIDVSTK